MEKIYISLKGCLIMKRLGRLEKLTESVGFVALVSLAVASEVIIGFGNGIYQQAKHLRHHIQGIKHKKEDCPSDASFFIILEFNN